MAINLSTTKLCGGCGRIIDTADDYCAACEQGQKVLSAVDAERERIAAFVAKCRMFDVPLTELADRIRKGVPPMLTAPCPHPQRKGKHEIYDMGEVELCRACGASRPRLNP